MKYIFLIILSLVLIPFSALAETATNIPYGPLDRQTLDVYAPKNAHHAPVMVFVHGGGWHIGKKEGVQRKPRAFNNEGFVFVSVGYPLLPEYPVDIQTNSIAMAVAWIVKNIENYGGNASKVHIMGHSAGAHLAALVATDSMYLDRLGVSKKVIKSVISVDGSSLNVPWRMRTLDESVRFAKRMFRNTFGSDPQYWRRFSPYHYLSRNEYIPPFLFLTAEEKTAYNIVSDGVVEKLRSFGITTKVVSIPNRNHATINRRMGALNDPAFREIMTFVNGVK